MNQQPSVGQIALGTMLGNIGCFLLWLLFSCIGFFAISLMGGNLIQQLQRSIR